MAKKSKLKTKTPVYNKRRVFNNALMKIVYWDIMLLIAAFVISKLENTMIARFGGVIMLCLMLYRLLDLYRCKCR